MAKRIIMIAPFDVLTGNLSGRQDLVYGQNDSKAYEAENGKQGAKNYKPRFIGAKRADGKSYFSVRMKSTTVLTSITRRNMAVIAVIAAIRSALVRNQPTLWQRINDAFAYLKGEGRLPEGQDTFGKWFSANIKQMIVYKRSTWAFTYVPLSFTITNPYDLGSSDALVIKNSVWVKFADMFAFAAGATIVFASIDGVKVVLRGGVWDDITLLSNPNYATNKAGLHADGADEPVTYNNQPVYLATDAVVGGDAIVNGGKYATIASE